MKTSKPFAFVLWADGADLPYYVKETLQSAYGFHFFHFIRHEPEDEPAPLISRLQPTPGKPHWHCLCHINRPEDYAMLLELIVRRWAMSHPEYGECPMSYSRSHDGKCNCIPAWLAYVIHDPRYMAYLEQKKERPESYKTPYSWDDIKSTSDELLNEQCLNAAGWIDKTCRALEQFKNAVALGASSRRLLPALQEMTSYSSMLACKTAFFAARIDEQLSAPPPLIERNVPRGTFVTHKKGSER